MGDRIKNIPMRYQEIFLVILNPPAPFANQRGRKDNASVKVGGRYRI
jgi:hypothetical protein